MLTAYHAKDPETCRWVIETFGHLENDHNESVKQWIQDSKDNLAELKSLPDKNVVHQVSKETLWHFNCYECKKWWSVANEADWKVKELYCTHCGTKCVYGDEIGSTGVV